MELIVIPFIVTFFPSIIIKPIIGFRVIVGIFIVGGISSPFPSETTMVLMLSSASDRLVVLPKQQEPGFLPSIAFQRQGLGNDQVSLPCQIDPSQQVPSLNFSTKGHVVVGEFVVETIMLSGELEQRLAAASMNSSKVLVTVSWQLNRFVVLDGLIELLEHLLKRACLLNVLDRKFSKSLQAVPVSEPMTESKRSASFFPSLIFIT